MRCKIDTDVGKLSDLLLNRWQLPKPNLLMSVFGGHGKFDSTEIGEWLRFYFLKPFLKGLGNKNMRKLGAAHEI